MGQAAQVALEFKDDGAAHELRRTLEWRGIAAELVSIRGPAEFAFKWTGDTDYLALHDLQLVDGETTLGEGSKLRLLDLRDRMTFVPAGSEISGWSRLGRRSNAFTAVYFDPATLAEEFGDRPVGAANRPMLYFEDFALRCTLAKIQALLIQPAVNDAAYAETLGLMAAMEIDRLQRTDRRTVQESGWLSPRQASLVREYVVGNLSEKITLEQLANVVGLSRFHFLRAFRSTFGQPPHRYLIRSRIERAKILLLDRRTSVAEVTARVGFTDQAQFARAFRKATGSTPSQFRRLNG